MKVLSFNPQLCDGTHECEVTCASTWFKTHDAGKSSIRITNVEGVFNARFCIQCGECISVCPVDALYRDKQGIVRVRARLCIGCMSCVGFCPHDAMYFDEVRALPFKCVACGQCVDTCPSDALKIIEVEQTPTTDVWHGKGWKLQ